MKKYQKNARNPLVAFIHMFGHFNLAEYDKFTIGL